MSEQNLRHYEACFFQSLVMSYKEHTAAYIVAFSSACAVLLASLVWFAINVWPWVVTLFR